MEELRTLPFVLVLMLLQLECLQFNSPVIIALSPNPARIVRSLVSRGVVGILYPKEMTVEVDSIKERKGDMEDLMQNFRMMAVPPSRFGQWSRMML